MPTAESEQARHERRMQALELRKRGRSYNEIGRELGISNAQAYYDVNHRLGEIATTERESLDEMRAIELERLDKLTNAIWDDCEAGDTKAVEAFLKIQQRRARLLGLDAATKIKVEGTTDNNRGRTPEQIYTRIRELHERLAAAGVSFHPMLLERNPFEKPQEPAVLEGKVVDMQAVRAARANEANESDSDEPVNE